VVTMAQKRLVKGEKKTGEMLFFPNFSLWFLDAQYIEFTLIYKG
jgi:hypothetical protein